MRKAAVRVSLAQLMDEDPRPVGEVLLDVVATFDAIWRNAKIEVGDTVTPEKIDRLLELGTFLKQAVKTVVDAGVAVELVHQRERDLQLEGRVITSALVKVVDELVCALAPVEQRNAYRQWAMGLAFAELGGHAPPHLSLPAVPNTEDDVTTDAVVDAVVIEDAIT
jgi:hypothetical protein